MIFGCYFFPCYPDYLFNEFQNVSYKIIMEPGKNPYLLTSACMPTWFGTRHARNSLNADGFMTTVSDGPSSDIMILNTSDGQEIALMDTDVFYRVDTLITPDGKKVIVFGGDDTIYIDDINVGIKKLARLFDIKTTFDHPVIKKTSRDSKLFCTRRKDGGIIIWDIESGREISRIDPHIVGSKKALGRALENHGIPIIVPRMLPYEHHTFSSDGSLLLVVVRRVIIVFDVTTGGRVHAQEFFSQIHHVDDLPNPNQFLLVDECGAFLTWDIIYGFQGRDNQYNMRHTTRKTIAISPDRTMVAYPAYNGNIVLADTKGNGTILQKFFEGDTSMCFSRDGKRLIVATKRIIYTYDTNTFPRCTREIFHTFDPEAKKVIRFLSLVHRNAPEKEDEKQLSRLEMLPRELIYVIFSHIRRSY